MLILLIALPLLTGLAAALPFPSRRGRLTFLLTMPGCPFIYYGDEIGMRYICLLYTSDAADE